MILTTTEEGTKGEEEEEEEEGVETLRETEGASERTGQGEIGRWIDREGGAPEWMWRMILISKTDQVVVGEEEVVNGGVMTMVRVCGHYWMSKASPTLVMYVWPI